MSKNEQFDGEFNEVGSNNGPTKQPGSKQQGLGKVFLIGLCAGVLGGGVAVGGFRFGIGSRSTSRTDDRARTFRIGRSAESGRNGRQCESHYSF